MKKYFRLLLTILVLVLVSSTFVPSSAASTADLDPTNCVPEGKVANVQFSAYSMPIRLLSRVEIVPICNGPKMALEVLEYGRYFYFDADIAYAFFETDVHAFAQARPATAGDRGMLYELKDLEDATRHPGTDGVVDYIVILEIPEWTEEEVAVMELGDQLYNEAVEGGWFLFQDATLCSFFDYHINGDEAATPGPYDGTFLVAPLGGNLVVQYPPGCIKGGSDWDWAVRTWYMRPGDVVTNAGWIASLGDAAPWMVCDWLGLIWPEQQEVLCTWETAE